MIFFSFLPLGCYNIVFLFFTNNKILNFIGYFLSRIKILDEEFFSFYSSDFCSWDSSLCNAWFFSVLLSWRRYTVPKHASAAFLPASYFYFMRPSTTSFLGIRSSRRVIGYLLIKGSPGITGSWIPRAPMKGWDISFSLSFSFICSFLCPRPVLCVSSFHLLVPHGRGSFFFLFSLFFNNECISLSFFWNPSVYCLFFVF